MMRALVPTVLAALLLAVVAGAQPTQPPAQTPPPTAAAKPQAPPRAPVSSTAGRASAAVMVTDQSGTGVPDVRVTVTGPVTREGTTARDGTLRLQGLRPGSYRLRFESPDFITLEKDVAIKTG